MRRGCDSRRFSRPATWSTSALVSTAPMIGLWRRSFLGCRISLSFICWRRSGDALNRYQSSPSELIAMDDWVRCGAAGSSCLARRLLGWLQFPLRVAARLRLRLIP